MNILDNGALFARTCPSLNPVHGISTAYGINGNPNRLSLSQHCTSSKCHRKVYIFIMIAFLGWFNHIWWAKITHWQLRQFCEHQPVYFRYTNSNRMYVLLRLHKSTAHKIIYLTFFDIQCAHLPWCLKTLPFDAKCPWSCCIVYWSNWYIPGSWTQNYMIIHSLIILPFRRWWQTNNLDS